MDPSVFTFRKQTFSSCFTSSGGKFDVFLFLSVKLLYKFRKLFLFKTCSSRELRANIDLFYFCFLSVCSVFLGGSGFSW